MPRSGSTLLYALIRSCESNQIETFNSEISALSIDNQTSKAITTKRPRDILVADLIQAKYAENESVKFVITIRDPRSAVSSMHHSAPGNWFHGCDYSMFIGDKQERSFCHEGAAATITACLNVINNEEYEAIVIRYEDLISNPRETFKRLSLFTGIEMEPDTENYRSKLTPSYALAIGEKRSISPETMARWHNDPIRISRVQHQLSIFPELEELCRELGYMPTIYWKDEIPQEASSTFARGTIVAFHTNDSIYRQEANRLKTSLEAIGIDFHIREIDENAKNVSEWVKYCAYKSSFLLEMREALSGPILYVDVDAIIKKDPFPYLAQYKQCDIATATLENGEHQSGTIFVNDTVGARNFLKDWHLLQQQSPATWDQIVLGKVVANQASKESRFVFGYLPSNLCHIFDREYPYTYGDVYIEHYQASREVKAREDRNMRVHLERRRNALKKIDLSQQNRSITTDF